MKRVAWMILDENPQTASERVPKPAGGAILTSNFNAIASPGLGRPLDTLLTFDELNKFFAH
jgi:hypothetical protein